MSEILKALVRAFTSLMHPRMLWLMVWPLVIAIALWATLGFLYWSEVAGWVHSELQRSAAYDWTLSTWPFTVLAAALGWLLGLLVFVPLVLVTAVLIIGVVSMPVMVRHVADRDYPALERRRGGGFAGSVGNAVAGLVVFLALALVTLPLWLVPALWPFLPLLLVGYLNQRVFRYDALAEHGSRTEIAGVIRRWRAEMFLLGVVLALAGHVPVLGLFMPVYAGLAYIHYGLSRLEQLRAGATGGAA
jgi:CysZ protein